MIKDTLAQDPGDSLFITKNGGSDRIPRVRFSIRSKITIPFLLLAIGLAIGAAYVVTLIVFDTIEQRFTNDLIDGGKRVSEGMVRREDDLLTQLRQYSHTVGIAEAIEARDATSLYELTIGAAANREDEFVEYLDNQGDVILSLRHRKDGGKADYDESVETNIDYQAIPFIKKVLDEDVDQEGDKYAGLILDSWSNIITIAGPVYNREGELSGVVIVGKTLSTLLRQLYDETLAQITIYDLSGQPLESTFVSPQPLDVNLANSLLVNQDSISFQRILDPRRGLEVSNIEYDEILGPWEIRNGTDLGIVGIALPNEFLVHASLPTRMQVSGLVTLMIFLVIIFGVNIASIITRPIKDLLKASSEVASGKLPVHVDPKGHDEITVLTNSFNKMISSLHESKMDLLQAYDSTLEGWSTALELRDRETNGHTRRVTKMTLDLARAIGIDGDELINIRRGAMLHDIGKMGIPDAILLKNGDLTPAEWKIMRKHPVYAFDMLWPIEYLRPAIDIPYCHHERWDGNGYPRGLQREDIPLAARIFSIVDVWDAMRSGRPYREALSQDSACEYIISASGSHFDPQVVDAFYDLIARLSCRDSPESVQIT